MEQWCSSKKENYMENQNQNQNVGETREYRTLRGLPHWAKNYYLISRDGEIVSTYGDRMRRIRWTESNGYAYVTLGGRRTAYTTPVHRLVAATYLGACPDGMEVHHIDGDKLNNNVENLKYVSRQSNMIRGWCSGQFDRVSAAVKNKREQLGGSISSLTEDDVRQIRRLRTVLTNAAIGYIFDLHPMQISRIVNRRSYANID